MSASRLVSGMIPVAYAAQMGLVQMTRALLKEGALRFYTDGHLWNTLHHAAAWNRTEIIEVLLQDLTPPGKAEGQSVCRRTMCTRSRQY